MNFLCLNKEDFSVKKTKCYLGFSKDARKMKDNTQAFCFNSIDQQNFSFIPLVLDKKNKISIMWRHNEIGITLKYCKEETTNSIDPRISRNIILSRHTSKKTIEQIRNKSIYKNSLTYKQLIPDIEQKIFEKSAYFSQKVFENLVFLETRGQGAFAKVIKCHNKID